MGGIPVLGKNVSEGREKEGNKRVKRFKNKYFWDMLKFFFCGGEVNLQLYTPLTFPKLHIKAPYTLISSYDGLGSYISRISFRMCQKDNFIIFSSNITLFLYFVNKFSVINIFSCYIGNINMYHINRKKKFQISIVCKIYIYLSSFNEVSGSA